VSSNEAADLRSLGSPLRTYRPTYGKVQAQNPGRWLTYDEAYGQLVGACQDDTLVGLRDEIVIRLGLCGMRLTEICTLTLDNLRHLPTITWTGKGRKPRRATAGTALSVAISGWLAAYPDPAPTDPLICRQVIGASRQGAASRIDWHHPAGQRTIFYAINGRAKQAGLGHVAPHDLRRTAAGILHRATDDSGAHHFDLLDIQRVLGHANPDTTVNSYLAPMQTEVLERAAAFLD
jgi:integrase